MSTQAQSKNEKTPNIKVGDTISLHQPVSGKYKYVKFPRENFVRKRGGISNLEAFNKSEVIVTKVKSTKDDRNKIKVKRINGKKFFNAYSTITIFFEDALGNGEINIKK
jgi:hypothetical protein